MEVRPLSPMRTRSASPIVQRVQAILDDEIAGGALTNITAADRVWSAHPLGPSPTERTRRLATEFTGLVDTVLDLLAPPPRPAAAQPPADPPAQDTPQRVPQCVEPIAVLRARRRVPPGGTAEIRTTVQNDDPTAIDIGFVWGDLVGEPRGRIRASRLRLLPRRLRVSPGATTDLTIGLDVPEDASPGLYHALLHAGERTGLCALLTFPVGFDVEQQAPVVM